jgi:hypothetical protein
MEETIRGATQRFTMDSPIPLQDETISTPLLLTVDDEVTIGFFTKVGVDGGAYGRKAPLDGKSLKVIASGRTADGSPYFDVIHYTAA